MQRKRSIMWTALLLGVGVLLAGGRAALAAKEVFIRSKPHVNVGTIGGQPTSIWLHAEALVLADGSAHGVLQLRTLGGETFLYRVVGGVATDEGGIVGDVFLILQRVGEGGEPTGETDFATVRPSSTSEPCRIYDIAGTQVHVEAETTVRLIGLRHEHTRPE